MAHDFRDNSAQDPLYTRDQAQLPADGALQAVPVSGALPGRPANAKTVALYLAMADTVTYSIGSASSMPTVTISGADFKLWTEDLGPNTNIFITNRGGAPSFRWL